MSRESDQAIIFLQKVDTLMESVALQRQLINAGCTIIDVQPVHNGYLAGFSYFIKYKGEFKPFLSDDIDDD